MSAVAEEVGAPSGSVYHRFAGRAALLAELWLRTVEDFQADYLAALGSDADAHRAARAAARTVVAWSRTHPAEAAVLLYDAGDFARADWSAEHLRRAEHGNQRVRAALAALGSTLGVRGRHAADRLALALVDLPLALVRRHLRAGGSLPAHAEDLAEECATALLETSAPAAVTRS